MCDNGGTTEKRPAPAETGRGSDRKAISDMSHSTEPRRAILDALGDTTHDLRRIATHRLILMREAKAYGATNQSIADVLGVTEPAVRSMLKRHA
jgi:hypothetical protein